MHLHLYLKLSLGIFFPGGLITFQVSHEGNFKPISGGVEEMKLSLSETELFEKKKEMTVAKFNIKKYSFLLFLYGFLFFFYE